jgi:uncharacterized protein YkwD
MRLCAALLLVLTFAAPVFAGCGGGLPAGANSRISAGNPDQAVFSATVAYYMNAERCRRGLQPLGADGALLTMAAGHSRNMARDERFSHQSGRSGWQTLSQRLRSAGVRASTAGENIAMEKLYAVLGRPISIKGSGNCATLTYADGQPVPAHSYKSMARQVVARLMASSKHRANILNPRFERGAAGLAVDAGGTMCGDVYVTQTFAG